MMMTSLIGALVGKAIGLELLFRWQERRKVAPPRLTVASGTLQSHGNGGGAPEPRPITYLLPPPD